MLRRFELPPLASAVAVLVYTTAMPFAPITGESIGLDTVLHIVVLVVALGYAWRNHRVAAAFIAMASPVIFLLILNAGPREATGGWIPYLPTVTTFFVAYGVANLVLVLALVIAGRRRIPTNPTAPPSTDPGGTCTQSPSRPDPDAR